MNLYFLYVLDIDIIRNGNSLKLKVKSEFSLGMGLMLINHSNPYTVEPPNKGQIGALTIIHYSVVVLYGGVVKKAFNSVLYR